MSAQRTMKRQTSNHPKGVLTSEAKDAARARARRWYQAHWEDKAQRTSEAKKVPVFHDSERFEIIAQAMEANRRRNSESV